jgi:hypothetical protein
MRDADAEVLLDRLRALERRVSGLRRWAVAATVVAVVAALLSCGGLGLALLPSFLRFGPAPVRRVGGPVTAETALAPGAKVMAQWGNNWWEAEVLAVQPDGRVKVHYTGWDASFDEVVPRERLRLPP